MFISILRKFKETEESKERVLIWGILGHVCDQRREMVL